LALPLEPVQCCPRRKHATTFEAPFAGEHPGKPKSAAEGRRGRSKLPL